MLRKRGLFAAAVVAALCVTGLFAASANAQVVSVHVVQVRASNEGGESVDPTLGALGERLKQTYPYRNYKRVGSSTESGAVGASLHFALMGGMALTLDIQAYEEPMVSMRAAVTRGQEQLVGTNLKVRKGGTVIISVPLGADKLILAITPSVR